MRLRVLGTAIVFCSLIGCGSRSAGSSATSSEALTTTQFFDDFGRTTGLGSSWSVASGAFTTDGTVARGTAAGSYAFWTGTPDPDATVSLSLSRPSGTYIGVVVRANPSAPAQDHYVGYVGPDGTEGIARRDSGTYTFLAQGPQLASGTHVLSLTATGSNPVVLSLVVDNQEVLHVVDSSAQARSSGRAGMFDYSGGSAPLDKFTVATTSATDAGTPDAGSADAGSPDAGTPSGSVLFSDNFNRSGSLGSSWTIASGAFTDNGSAAVATASSSFAFWTGLPDRDASVSIRLTAPVGNTYAGVMVRANTSSPASDNYVAYVGPDGAAGIARRNGGAYTFLATGPVIASGSHVLSFSATGASPVVLVVQLDGVEVLRTTDASNSLTSAGRAGIFDYNGLGTPLDDFTVRGAGATVTDGGTPDAGTDAGTPDAGVPPDAGTDAGTPDAGVPPDAGVSDAGTPTGALFFDAFNRTGALGSNWIIGSGAFTDNGSAAVATASSSLAFWTGLPDRDASVSIDVTAPVGNTYLGVMLRASTTSPTSDNYVAYFSPDGAMGVARRNANAYTFLATGPAVAAGPHTLSFSATGSSPVVLSVRLDGVEVIHITDSSTSLTSAGRAGIIDFNGSGHPIDNFTVRAGSSGGTDAGTPDAGTPDAGTPDAGTPDAGTPDAGTPDAGTSDGGTNPIVQENALAGSTGWQMTSTVGTAELGGYLSTDSAIAGDTVVAYVHSRVTSSVTWQLYRIGWYGGAGGRLIQQGQFTAGPQASCPKDSSTGLVECNWSASFSFAARPEWVSGVYEVILTRADGAQSSLIFTLRDNRRAAVMVQQSVTTWQAYNEYGGESLYVTQLPLPQLHAVKVSFARPYLQLNGDFDYFEADFVRWLESQGFDVTYVTNLDFSRDQTTPQRAKVFLVVGHDEYWSLAERDGLEAARAAGVSEGYFTADEGYWQIRVEAAPSGSYRRLVCYKDFSDPLYPSPQTTVTWRDPPVNRPENALIGVMSDVGEPVELPFTVDVPNHWLFAGTGLAAGDTIAQIEGYETDRRFDNGLTPAGAQRLAGHPLVDVNGTASDQEMTLYTASSGAIILGTGTIQWGWGLYAPGVADARLQRITTNFLEMAGAFPATPRTLPVNQNAWSRADVTGASSAVSTIAGVPGTHGSTDGAAAQATFQRPGGIVVASDGTIYVTDAAASRIRKISNGQVSTLAGSSDGYADGTGTQARFRGPQGLAIASDGSLLVADTGNHCIRRVTTTGVVSTYAGACGAQGESNGSLGSARFDFPTAIAVGPSGAAYVADGRGDAIRKIASGQVSTLAASPNGGTSVFYIPNGLAVGSDETVYVVDSGHRAIKRVSPSGSVSTVLSGNPASAPYELRTGFGGFADGPLSSALAEPALGIAVVGSTLYFSDSGNDRIRRIDLSTSRVTTFAGTGRARCEDGPGSQAGFEFPQGIAAGQGALFVADSCGAIRRIAIP